MARSHKVYGFWEEHDGKTVLLSGIKHTLRCRTYTQRYPYEELVIDVSAEPLHRDTKFYRETKEQLGDDWSTDVLASDIEVQSEILSQLS